MRFLANDLRFALRTLRKRPAFTATVVATLGMAIGASTSIFSVVEATLLRPLPFAAPKRVVMLWGVAGPQRAIRGASFIEVEDWARLNRAFDDVSIYDQTSLNLRTTAGADRIAAEMVSASFFRILGVTPELGRVFSAEEDRVPDAHAVAVISDGMWRSRFAADPAVVGRVVTLNEQPFTIVGVMRPGFKGLSFDTDLWFPSMMAHANGAPRDLADRGTRWLGAVGLMKTGQSLSGAQSDADRVAERLARDFPTSNKDRGIQLVPLRDSYLGTTKTLMLAVFAGVGLLLLIACANVVGLQLVRASSRGHEIAVRIAIGAERSRLVQQLVVEGLVLAIASAVVGLTIAYWGVQALVALVPPGLFPNYAAPSIDPAAYAFALAIAVACGVASGSIPGLRGARLSLSDSLRNGARGTAAGTNRRGRKIGSQQLLVAGEAAVASVLLIGAGLFARSLERELAVPLGFEPQGLLGARLDLPQQYSGDAGRQLIDQLQARVSALPSVRGVAIGSDLPLGDASSAGFIDIPDDDESVRYYRHSVTPEYIRALGVHVLGGRAFTHEDRATTPPVVVINESMAQRFWPAQTAIGKTVRLGSATSPGATIVGVVSDVRQRDLTTPLATTEPDVYFPMAQRGPASIQLAVRSDLAPAALAASVRRELMSIDPTIPLYDVHSFESALERQTAGGRFASTLLTVFGAAALLLTAVGLYGVLAFFVSSRSREIGIRIALGATAAHVARSVVAQGVGLVIVGAAAGLAAAAMVTRWIASQLYGVGARDPMVFVAVPVLLLIVTIAASWIPARRATRVDPQAALRAE